MKKATYTVIVILLCTLALASCEKQYHCGCSFNSKIVYTKDLGTQTKKNAETICTGYDTTVAGETWNCTLY